MTRALVVGAALGVVACGGRSGGQPATPAADSVSVTGVVRVEGADPVAQVVVRPEAGPAAAVVGPLRGELAQAIGLVVRVAGTMVEPVMPPLAAIEVRSYETVSLNGVPAHSGILERSGADLVLVGVNRRWVLATPPEEIRAAIGAKVWVAGQVGGEALHVSAYGILKEPPRH